MSCETPLVSVVLPVFGNLQDLETTVDSILHQSLSAFELIIIDDGNHGADRDVIAAVARRDARIRVLQNPTNRGATVSNMLGCRAARGRYIAKIDNGDLMVPHTRLEEQASLLEEDPSLAIVGGGLEIVDALNGHCYRSRPEYLRHEEIVNKPGYLTYFPQVTVMMRTLAYVQSGGYNPQLPVGADTDLWPRILRYGRGLLVPTVYAVAVMKPGSISVARNNKQILSKIDKIRQSRTQGGLRLSNLYKLILIAVEFGKLALPDRIRVFLRYRKQMNYVYPIDKDTARSLAAVRRFYSQKGLYPLTQTQ